MRTDKRALTWLREFLRNPLIQTFFSATCLDVYHSVQGRRQSRHQAPREGNVGLFPSLMAKSK